MPKKDSTSKSVVPIKLGSSLSGPTKRMLRDLRDTAMQCNAIRTMAEGWVIDTCERSVQEALRKIAGMRRVEAREKLILSKRMPELVLLKRLYKPEMVGLFPGVSSALVSACCQDVVQRLSAKMPRRFDRPKPKGKRVWQGILLGEAQRAVYGSLRLPCLFGKNMVSKLTHIGERRPYVLDFPLFSKQSGRDTLRARCRMHVREHGKRDLIRRIIAESCARDSEIVYDTDKESWTLQLVYVTPNIQQPHPENVAELVLAAPSKADYPMALLRDGVRPWWIGRGGKFVVYREDYLWRKRKVMGLRYQDVGTETTVTPDNEPGRNSSGHGRGEVYRKLRPQVRAAQDRRKQFVRDLIRDVTRYCERNGIGKLIWWEPSMPLRNGTWFSRNGVPFNWSTFTPRLVAKLQSLGIDCEVRTERLERHCERWGCDSKAVFARMSQRIGDTEVANAVYVYGDGQARHDAAPLATGNAERTGASGSEGGGEVGA